MQVPQLMSPPHPSPVGPHLMFDGQAWGWHVSAVNESATNSATVTAYVECGRWE